MIHILTGWSKLGGSTEAHISLCNAFNKYGYDCCLYGSDPFPSKRCKFKYFVDFNPSKNDILISHFINPDNIGSYLKGNTVSKHILSCHESELFPLKFLNYKVYDKIHFVSKWQKDYHNIQHPSFICSNIIDNLKFSADKPKIKIGAVIGSIDKNKNVHVSIQKALKDKCQEVLIFGAITDKNYFQQFVLPLLSDKVKYMGIMTDKQCMYDFVTDVYNFSFRETFGLVHGECIKTGTRYHSNFSNYNYMSEEDIIKIWKRELEL